MNEVHIFAMVPTTWHDLCNKSCRYILYEEE